MTPGNGYSHAVSASGRLVAIAGQVAMDEHGELVGPGDPVAQTERVFENLRLALAAGGATFAEILKFGVFVTDMSILPVVREIRDRHVDRAQPRRAPRSRWSPCSARATSSRSMHSPWWRTRQTLGQPTQAEPSLPRRTTVTTTDTTSTVGAYADVNGLHLYYETQGTGRPLILIHGGLGSGDMFGPVRTELAANHQVITPDLQGHGRTADIDRPLDVRLMADDIAALIRHLGLDRPDLVGYSLGGGVALMTAIKYPELVRKVVVASAHIKYDALDPAMYAQQEQVGAAAADALKGTPMYEGYVPWRRARRTSRGCSTRSARA